MTELEAKILAHKHLRSTKIADIVGCSDRYARRILRRHGVSHPTGPPPGADNPSWVGGRMVDLDGYVLLKNKPGDRVIEHQVVMAQTLGRELLPGEVVDHIDGITIHNSPENLRLFASNGEHLRSTASGSRMWSAAGRQNIGQRTDLGARIQRVDTYRLRKERGDVRLRAILRAVFELGIEHPCLSGTLHWLERAGIDPQSRPSLERGWAELESRYAADLLR